VKPHATQVLAPVTLPSRDEIGQLARLAFASRAGEDVPLDARPLSFLPPDALDMDLSDPIQRDFGEYELLEKIGQGGMGVVYRARQHALDREVALKLLAAGPWASREFIQRFRREAQSAARLEHPNIVAVYESGVQHELHFFSMRLVRGESLAALLARDGPRAPREAARLLLRIAEALDYAHRLGVLHLDLKPGNVLIDEAGETAGGRLWPGATHRPSARRRRRRCIRHAVVHGAGAGHGALAANRAAHRHLRPWRDPVRSADRATTVPRRHAAANPGARGFVGSGGASHPLPRDSRRS
jgi:hypothetical protein